METISSTTYSVSKINKSNKFTVPSLFGTSWEKIQDAYYPLIVMTMMVGSIISGMAAAAILHGNAPVWQLIVCAALAMFNNTTAIGGMPARWVVYSFATTIIVNSTLFLVNTF